jgi:Flp pilus assembly protein protease CpaA
MNALSVADAALLVGCLLASYTDARTGKIFNALTGPMILAGLLIHGASGNLLFGVAGFFCALAIHLPLWQIGIQKGGDAKLLLGIGALVGWVELLETTFWYALLYIPASLAVLVYRRRLGNLVTVGKHLAASASGKAGDEPAPAATVLWTAPVISAAALAARLTVLGSFIGSP